MPLHDRIIGDVIDTLRAMQIARNDVGTRFVTVEEGWRHVGELGDNSCPYVGVAIAPNTPESFGPTPTNRTRNKFTIAMVIHLTISNLINDRDERRRELRRVAGQCRRDVIHILNEDHRRGLRAIKTTPQSVVMNIGEYDLEWAIGGIATLVMLFEEDYEHALSEDFILRYGEIYSTGGGMTTTTGSPVLLVGLDQNGEMDGFDRPSDSRLRYLGVPTRRFKAEVNLRGISGGGSPVTILFAVNGVQQIKSRGGEEAASAILTLNQNDYVEVRIDAPAGTYTINGGNFSLMELAG